MPSGDLQQKLLPVAQRDRTGTCVRFLYDSTIFARRSGFTMLPALSLGDVSCPCLLVAGQPIRTMLR